MTTANQALDFLLETNVKAFGLQDYETAYHSLASAMHLAQAMIASDVLQIISRTASAQLVEIDDLIPENKYASKAARTRGNISIFARLSSHANIACTIAKARLGRNETGIFSKID
jgi:hypothetical protein